MSIFDNWVPTTLCREMQNTRPITKERDKKLFLPAWIGILCFVMLIGKYFSLFYIVTWFMNKFFLSKEKVRIGEMKVPDW